ncbi:MAG: hypothetical protein Q4P08_03205 [Eubacteriales bacterium]|nr:hypothetical protein [Eubacteriales bacterium]
MKKEREKTLVKENSQPKSAAFRGGSRGLQAKLSLFLSLILLSGLISLAPVEAKNKGNSASFGSFKTDKVKDLDFLDYVENTELEGAFSEFYRAEDIHLPYFELKGAGAEFANYEIDLLAKEIARTFDDEETVESFRQYFNVNYSVYENEDVLSLMINLDIIDGSPYNKIVVYNLDLDSGDLMSDEDFLEYLDLDESFPSVIEKNIIKDYQMTVLNYGLADDVEPLNITSSLIGECFDSLWADYADTDKLRSVNLFLDSSGRPFFSYEQFIPAGAGFYLKALPLDNYKGLKEDELNPFFVKVANEFGLDIEDDEIYAMIADLGTMDFSDSKFTDPLYALYKGMDNYIGPDILSEREWSDDEGKSLVTGTQAILIIPRYAHATINLVQDYDGYFSANDFDHGMEDVLVILPKKNKDKIHVGYRYRDSEMNFLPKYKNGKLIAPEGFLDITEELNQLEAPEDLFYLDIQSRLEEN